MAYLIYLELNPEELRRAEKTLSGNLVYCVRLINGYLSSLRQNRYRLSQLEESERRISDRSALRRF